MFLLSLLVLPFFIKRDPAPGVFQSLEASRRMDCEPLPALAAEARRPGEVVVSKPRGDYIERTEVICAERLLAPGVRAARDEAILNELGGMTAEMASAVASRRPDLAGRTWLVEAYYPDPSVTAKLSFAAKNALMAQGLTVTDRAPVLSAVDLDVLMRMSPAEAYPAACLRYTATGGLGQSDALLAVVSRDQRETLLHAGLCVDGAWSWLL